LVPTATTIAMLVNPGNPNAATDVKAVEASAKTLGLQLLVLRASNERETEAAFAVMAQRGAGALLVGIAAALGNIPPYIFELAMHNAIPAIYPWREHAMAGGLMSYGADLNETHRQLGIYAGRILKGAKPADLPVWEAVRVELVINLKTAKALGITFPITLL